MQNVNSPSLDPDEAGAPADVGFRITPAMIEAGADVLLSFDVVEYDQTRVVIAVLEAMGAGRDLAGLSFQRKSDAVDRQQIMGSVFLATGQGHWKTVLPDQK